MNRIRDKVVLITGASSGIGRATAVRLAGLGARLALAARSPGALEETAREVRAQGGQALVLPTDVTDAEQCRRAVELSVTHYGQLDVLLCSAGVSLRADFADTALPVFERILRVNFFGTLYATYHAIPHLKTTQGSLVAVSSLTGKRGIPSYAVYGASKFAIQGLYQSLRVELRPFGIHVGVVAPGFVDTPLRERVLGPDGQTWAQPPALPFRLWPVRRCVDRIINLIQKRKSEVLLPGFVGALLTLDSVLGGWLGDRFLARRFRPESGSHVAAGERQQAEDCDNNRSTEGPGDQGAQGLGVVAAADDVGEALQDQVGSG
jgi:NAD(P)-dependent dehydrogenase (short-subunit alcohol dehydrogenase family)